MDQDGDSLYKERGDMDTTHPRMQQLSDNLSAIHAEVSGRKLSESTTSLCVLVVDSDRNFLFRVRNFLMYQGIEVMTVLDGLSGLTLFHNHSFDAIVTGPSITRLGGDIFAQYVKNAILPLPVIGMGNSHSDREHHFDAVIEVPLQPDALLKEIFRLTVKDSATQSPKEISKKNKP